MMALLALLYKDFHSLPWTMIIMYIMLPTLIPPILTASIKVESTVVDKYCEVLPRSPSEIKGFPP